MAISGLKSQIFLMRAIVIARCVADSAECRPSFGRTPLLAPFVLLKACRRCSARLRTGSAISVQPAVAVCSGVIAFLQRTSRISSPSTLVFLTILKPSGQQSTSGVPLRLRILTQRTICRAFPKERSVILASARRGVLQDKAGQGNKARQQPPYACPVCCAHNPSACSQPTTARVLPSSSINWSGPRKVI